MNKPLKWETHRARPGKQYTVMQWRGGPLAPGQQFAEWYKADAEDWLRDFLNKGSSSSVSWITSGVPRGWGILEEDAELSNEYGEIAP